MTNLAKVCSTLGLAVAAVPWFALALPPIGVAFAKTTERYRRSSREAQRLLAISRSPLFTLVDEGIGGLVPLRAFGPAAVAKFGRRFDERLARSTAWAYLKVSGWVGGCVGGSVAKIQKRKHNKQVVVVQGLCVPVCPYLSYISFDRLSINQSIKFLLFKIKLCFPARP